MHDLREKTARAAIFNVGGHAAGLIIRIVSIMILGRLLDPADYGVVAMVTAFTGVLNMFAGFGLFQAAIQRETLNEGESSSLFWMNLALGAALALTSVAAAPFVALFYHEPRLVAVTQIIGLTFLIVSAGIQHGVLLHRRIAFGISAAIDIISLLIGTAVSIGMAMTGWGYWALVSMTITQPLATTIALWIATGWIPGRPRMAPAIKSMLKFGLGSTLNGFIAYLAGNIDKLLLGRVWGTEAVGLYGRTFHLINFPGDTLNSTIGEVCFAALSRARTDPERFRRYFLKGYSLVVTLTLPLTMVCALFADDLVVVILGEKWTAASEIFRILAPTMLALAILQPLGWLLNSLGMIKRGVYIASASAPLYLAAVLIGLPYGPIGVAIAYSAATLIKLVPISAWAVRGTGIHLSDILRCLRLPFMASVAATAIAFASRVYYIQAEPAALRLVLEIIVFGAVYSSVLWLIAGQQAFYLDLLRAGWTAPQA